MKSWKNLKITNDPVVSLHFLQATKINTLIGRNMIQEILELYFKNQKQFWTINFWKFKKAKNRLCAKYGYSCEYSFSKMKTSKFITFFPSGYYQLIEEKSKKSGNQPSSFFRYFERGTYWIKGSPEFGEIHRKAFWSKKSQGVYMYGMKRNKNVSEYFHNGSRKNAEEKLETNFIE